MKKITKITAVLLTSAAIVSLPIFSASAANYTKTQSTNDVIKTTSATAKSDLNNLTAGAKVNSNLPSQTHAGTVLYKAIAN